MSGKIKCIIVDDEKVAREVLETHLARIDNVEVIASCKNAIEAIKAISEKQIELAFLDINMPEIDGLTFAKTARRDLKIIFTTAYRDYAVEGFDIQAVDYLLKPISFERLLQAITKYQETVAAPDTVTFKERFPNPECFFIRSDRKMIRIKFKDILFIESLSDYIKIHLTGKSVISRETLSNIEMILPDELFIRVHRSYIVSIDKIDSYTNEDIEIGKLEIPLSRSFKAQVLEKLMQRTSPDSQNHTS